MKLATRISSIRRQASKTGRRPSPASASRCGRLRGEVAAHRVDALAAGLQHPGHRVLRQPVDDEIRAAGAQLADDGHVAPGVPEADGRRHDQRPARPGHGTAPHEAGRRAPERALGELAQHEVEAHRLPRLRAVAGALEGHELRPGAARELGAPVRRHQRVLVPLEGDGRAGQPTEEVVHALGRHPGRADGVGQRPGVALEGPSHAVLDLLGGVRLGEAPAEEELRVAPEVPGPVARVLLGPALVRVQRLVEGESRALGERRGDRELGRHEERAGHPLGVLDGQDQGARGAAAVHHEHAPIRAGGVEHRQGVGRPHVDGVGRRRVRAVRAARATRVVGDDAEVPGQVRHLRLPEPGVDDGPGRHQEQRLRPGAEDLVRQGHAVVDGVALGHRRQARIATRPLPRPPP